MKLAAMDIGTNSTRLLIVNTIGPYRRDLYRSAVVTRLGEDVNATRLIKREAIERTLDIVEKYLAVMGDFGATELRAVATSAARDASNADELIFEFKKRTGMKLDILTGDEEAELTYTGAIVYGERFQAPGRTIVIDVGGGSTEYVWGRESSAEDWKSVDIGSVRLTERYVVNDPPTDEEVSMIGEVAEKATARILIRARDTGIDRAVAVAGTATTLAAVKHELDPYDPEVVHGSKLTREDIARLLERFRSMKTTERAQIVGLQPGRADIIIAGTLILKKTLEFLGLEELVVSERDILDGLIASMLQRR